MKCLHNSATKFHSYSLFLHVIVRLTLYFITTAIELFKTLNHWLNVFNSCGYVYEREGAAAYPNSNSTTLDIYDDEKKSIPCERE